MLDILAEANLKRSLKKRQLSVLSLRFYTITHSRLTHLVDRNGAGVLYNNAYQQDKRS